MKILVQFLVILAGYVVLALPVATSAFALCGSVETPEREILRTAVSPSGEHTALVVHVSGGGAAGYSYDDVVLVHRGREIRLVHRAYAASVEWLGEKQLAVRLGSGAAGMSEFDGVQIFYPQSGE